MLAAESASTQYLRPQIDHLAAAVPNGDALLIALAAAIGAGLASRMLPRLHPASS